MDPHHASRMLMAPRSALTMYAAHTLKKSLAKKSSSDRKFERKWTSLLRFDFNIRCWEIRWEILIVQMGEWIMNLYIYRNYLIFKQLLTLKLNILQNVEIDRFVLFDTEKKKN